MSVRQFALCAIDALADPGTRGFEIDVGAEQPLRVFALRKGGVIAVYRNRCPHTGAPLEWQPHQFLDIDNGFVQCAIHGALFRPDDGYCVRGPCVGQSLEAMPWQQNDGFLYLCLAADDSP